MAITRSNPNTVFLGGQRTQVNDLAASEVITPGMVVERNVNAGVFRWRKNTIVAAGANIPIAFATDHAMANKGVDDTYAAGDLVEVSIGEPGSVFWALIASGQIIVAGDRLQTVNDGTVAKYSSGLAIGTALEAKTNNGPTALMRIRMEVGM